MLRGDYSGSSGSLARRKVYDQDLIAAAHRVVKM
jgi:hypothetical protein